MNFTLNKRVPVQLLKAFSLVEMMVILSILSALLAMGLSLYYWVTKASQHAKLESDIANLNSSVKVYQSSGGVIEGSETLDQILSKLKSTTKAEFQDQMVGLSGRFLDPRVYPVMQSASEASTTMLRAYWDAKSGTFIKKTTGPPGIKEFRIDTDSVENYSDLTESRESTLQYANSSTWIWDYTDETKAQPVSPTSILVSLETETSTIPLIAVSEPTAPLVSPNTLLPPTFSIPSGTYSINDFDLTVQINDPNSPTSSSLYYSVDYAPWIPYPFGGITVTPNQVIEAQSVSSSPEFLSSSAVEATYTAASVSLLKPETTASAPEFIPATEETITINIMDPNSKGSALEFRIEGGSWKNYLAAFDIELKSYPQGATIEARATPQSKYYLGSPIETTMIGVGALAIPSFPTNAILIQGSVSQMYSVQVDAASLTGSYSPLTGPNGAGVQYNGVGYRPSDGGLYGMNPSTGQLLKIDPTSGAPTAVANLGVTSAYAGDFNTDNGFYYVKRSTESKLYVIDVDAGIVVQQLTISPTVGLIGDLAYNSADGHFYSYYNQQIYVIDPFTGAASVLPAHASNPSGHAGAAFASGGNVFLALNGGGLYWVNTTDGKLHYIASSPSSSLNDGALVGP